MINNTNQRSGSLPPVVKNLLIINAIFFIATKMLQTVGVDLVRILGLHYFDSEYFRIFQPITHMFMHGGLTHLAFNMYALWLFGRVLEGVWGSKRFLIYYAVTGIGAAALHSFVNWLEIMPIQRMVEAFANTPTPELFSEFINRFDGSIGRMFDINQVVALSDQWLNSPENTQLEAAAVQFSERFLNALMNIPTVGASGAVFGLLLAFGMLFPNTQIFLMFIPVPIKAKYFVMGYGLFELIAGITNTGGNIAHFAHLGGMLFGYLLLKQWKQDRSNFY